MQYGISMSGIIERKMQKAVKKVAESEVSDFSHSKDLNVVLFPEFNKFPKGFFLYSEDYAQYYGALSKPGDNLRVPPSYRTIEFPLTTVRLALSLRKEFLGSSRPTYFDCEVDVALVNCDQFLRNNPTKRSFVVIARELIMLAFYDLPRDENLLMNPNFLEICFSKALHGIGANVEGVSRMVKVGAASGLGNNKTDGPASLHQ